MTFTQTHPFSSLVNKFPFISTCLSIFILVFAISSCKPPTREHHDAIEPIEIKELPRITYLDIFNNIEFKQRLTNAIISGNEKEILQLQSQAVEIANAAGFESEQIAMLSGKRGINFIQYTGARFVFEQEFARRYNALEDITELRDMFPQAADLYEKAEKSVKQRNIFIIDIAKQIAGENGSYNDYMEDAKKVWLEKSKAKQN